MKRIFFTAVLFIGLLNIGMIGWAEKKIKVVTTLTTFADLVRTIGGDYVDVSYIAPPRFNPHFIEPKPSDILKVKKADLFVHAGLDLELWRWPLVDAAGNLNVKQGGAGELDLSEGIRLLEIPDKALTRASGDIHIYGNPHYWTDPENAKIMAKTICKKLTAIDSLNARDYENNYNAFTKIMDQKIRDWKRQLEPLKGMEVVGYHRSWPYLMNFVNMRMECFLEPKPGIPATPKQIEYVEKYILERNIRGIVESTFDPSEAAETVSKKTGAKVLVLCQNVGELPEIKNYVSMIEYNVRELVDNLQR